MRTNHDVVNMLRRAGWISWRALTLLAGMVLLLLQLLGVLAGLAFREVDCVQKDTARSPFW